jgi:hypothetical protein
MRRHDKADHQQPSSLLATYPMPSWLRPPTAPPAVTRTATVKGGTAVHAYVDEAARNMKRAATLTRAAATTGSLRSTSARERVAPSTPEEVPKRPERPRSARPDGWASASPLLTPDASFTRVSVDGSPLSDFPDATPDHATTPNLSAPSC